MHGLTNFKFDMTIYTAAKAKQKKTSIILAGKSVKKKHTV